MPRILMVTSEASPYVKTGGLGDVLGALPAALDELIRAELAALPAGADIDRDALKARIGTALMEVALKWVPKGAFVGLFTPKPAFYERLGFLNEGGMHRKA